MDGPFGSTPFSDVLWNNPATPAAAYPPIAAFDSRTRTIGMGFLMGLLLILLGV